MSKIKLRQALSTLKWQNFVGLTIAGIINAIGVTIFLSPGGLFDSGISGTSMLFAKLMPYLPLSIFLVVLNIPFYIIGIKKQGIHFTIYSIYTIAMYSFVAFLITEVIPIDLTVSPIVGDDTLLCCIFGGIVSGVGSGLTIRFGGALDGVEVMAVTFAKFIGLTVGTFVMIYNAVLYIVVGIIFGTFTVPLYSIITYMVGLKAVDFVVEGFDKAKAAVIITSKRDLVSKQISENLGRGVTILDAEGYYSKESKAFIYCVINRFQIGKLKKVVSAVDPLAFVTITEVADTFGQSKRLAKFKDAKKNAKVSRSQKIVEENLPENKI